MANKKISALTALTAPDQADYFPIIDASEADATKNKRTTIANLFQNMPYGTAGAPALRFTGDTTTGLYRSGANEIDFSVSGTHIASVLSTGLSIGTGTAAAQLHLFSTDTTDQVIIENTNSDTNNAPDLVLYRNKDGTLDPNPIAANDPLGNIQFRGKTSTNASHDYASIFATIEDPTNAGEDGILDIANSHNGTLASRIRLKLDRVGINEATPLRSLHVTSTITGPVFRLESTYNDNASGADIELVRRRGTAAGQDADVLSSIYFKGKNDATTPQEITYGAIDCRIEDASDGSEDALVSIWVQKAGTLTSTISTSSSAISCNVPVTIVTGTPASATASGVAGHVTWDASYIYVCTATNTWKRAALATW